MSPPQRTNRTDVIAREAARLLAAGRAADMRDAIRLAGQAHEQQGAIRAKADSHSPGRPPSVNRVRRHAQAMSMQAMGEEAYRQRVGDLLALAEDLMTTLEQALGEKSTRLAGRAAEGHFDADPKVHVRVLSEESATEIARALQEFGYENAEMTFTTLEARFGRLSQIQWTESGARIILTRCPQRSVFESATDLVTGKAVALLTLERLRERLRAP